MEFTGPNTPQRNYLAEIGFAVIWGRAQAIMEGAEVPEETKCLLYQEAISHTSKIDGYTLVTIKEVIKTRYEYLFGWNSKFTNFLRP